MSDQNQTPSAPVKGTGQPDQLALIAAMLAEVTGKKPRGPLLMDGKPEHGGRITKVAGEAVGTAPGSGEASVSPAPAEPVAAHSASPEPPPAFCAGISGFHTNEPGTKTPKPYYAVTFARIREMCDNPPQVPKEQGKWFIPSTLLSRTFEEQRKHGRYGSLTCDFDINPQPLSVVAADVSEAIGGANFETYNSRGAKPEKPKSRALIELAELVDHETWLLCQGILYSKLQAKGHTLDLALLRSGQLVYLPNRGELYAAINERGAGVFNPLVAWADELDAARAERVAKVEEANRVKEAATKAREARQRQIDAGEIVADEDLPITAFNAKVDPIDIMVRNGYEEDPSRPGYYCHPASETGVGSAHLLDDGRVYSHSAADPLGAANNDGHACSAFDVLAILEYGWDMKAAFKAITRTSAADEFAEELAGVDGVPPKQEPAATPPVIGTHDKNFRDFVKKLNWQCCQTLGEGNWIDEASLWVAWSRCFAGANGPGGAVYFGLLQADGTLRYDGQKDFLEVVLPRTFKNLRTREAMAKLEELIEAAAGPARDQLIQWRRWDGYYGQLIDELKMFRKVSATSMDVDMFSKRGSVEITPGHVRVRESFRLKTLSPVEQVVIDMAAADFKLHFPQFDTFLDMILHARFAADRKEAFTWLHAVSDWGKGFLMGVMNALGLGVELSVALINKAIAGETVPLQASEIHRTWVVFVDEWKGASRELKQLNSEMTVAAKYANRVAVQLYAKVFMSAESVASMIEGGVESQFNNRFSYMSPTPAKLNDRPVFNQLGGGVYLLGVAHYAATRINEGVARMRALGAVEAARVSGAWLHSNRLANSMEDNFGSLDEGMTEAANEIRDVLLRVAALKLSGIDLDSRKFAGKYGLDHNIVQMAIRTLHIGWVRDKDGLAHRVAYLRKPEHFVKSYLNQGSTDRSSAGKLAYKARDIGNMLSVATDLKVPLDTRGRVRIYAGTDTILPGNGEQVGGVILGLVKSIPTASFDDV